MEVKLFFFDLFKLLSGGTPKKLQLKSIEWRCLVSAKDIGSTHRFYIK
jgi:hypothetical protein